MRVSTPALFTMMSSRPKLLTAASMSFCRSARLATSARTPMDRLPRFAICCSSALGRFRMRHKVDDDACALARQSTAIAWPMPLLPPVTMATLFFSDMM